MYPLPLHGCGYITIEIYPFTWSAWSWLSTRGTPFLYLVSLRGTPPLRTPFLPTEGIY